MSPSALVIGGTGPTGPHVASGLGERGYDVTILHTGNHEIPEVEHLRHIHTDPWSADELAGALEGEAFDLVIAMYGRLRTIAELFTGRCDRFLSVGGAPAYRGYMNADRYTPMGMPTPTPEDAERSNTDDDGKSYRVARTEEILFEIRPDATHFRYPYVYGPRQLVPREWCAVRRLLDGRRRIIVPDGGLTVSTFGYIENLAHAIMLAVDRPDVAAGEIYNLGDEEALSLRQVVELSAAALGRDVELVNLPWELATPARPMVMAHRTTHRMLDLGKIRHQLGYRDVVPARQAIGLTAEWLAANPPEPGGAEERVLEDPFDYAAEDRLLAAWDAAVASLPDPEFSTVPGLGLSYSGPDGTYVRPDTRI